jgi:hypothetical protein
MYTLKDLRPGDHAIIACNRSGYRELVKVQRKTPAQIIIQDERKFNTGTGRMVGNPKHPHTLRTLTSDELDNIEGLQAREHLIDEIKGHLQFLDYDVLNKIFEQIQQQDTQRKHTLILESNTD